MVDRELLPQEDSIVLGPADPESGIWELKFRERQSGEMIRIQLPLEQLEEMDSEFTGLEHLF